MVDLDFSARLHLPDATFAFATEVAHVQRGGNGGNGGSISSSGSQHIAHGLCVAATVHWDGAGGEPEVGDAAVDPPSHTGHFTIQKHPTKRPVVLAFYRGPRVTKYLKYAEVSYNTSSVLHSCQVGPCSAVQFFRAAIPLEAGRVVRVRREWRGGNMFFVHEPGVCDGNGDDAEY